MMRQDENDRRTAWMGFGIASAVDARMLFDD
jgi:hypothetical protein